MQTKTKIRFPVGAVAAILIAIYTVQIDIWSKLAWWNGALLGFSLIVLFFYEFEWTHLTKDES